ncbi:hypothetical protein D3C80_2079210 [compost metagenome]
MKRRATSPLDGKVALFLCNEPLDKVCSRFFVVEWLDETFSPVGRIGSQIGQADLIVLFDLRSGHIQSLNGACSRHLENQPLNRG